MGSPTVLAAANRRRQAGAAEATTAAVLAVLEHAGDAAPQHLVDVGRIRVTYPAASLRELAEYAGMSKDTVASRLRRLAAFNPTRRRRYSRPDPQNGRPIRMRSLSYLDAHGSRRTLSWVQWWYLDTADRFGGFERGWDGLDSTVTARLLRDRGLIGLDDTGRRRSPWRVTCLTQLGRDVLAEWRRQARQGPGTPR